VFPGKVAQRGWPPEEVMERSWFETIQLLGLDVEVVIVLLMLALDRAATLARALAGAVAGRSGSARGRPAARTVAESSDAWPPKEWRPSH
jgi:hypothetical protein